MENAVGNTGNWLEIEGMTNWHILKALAALLDKHDGLFAS
jgi:hypothetical protein